MRYHTDIDPVLVAALAAKSGQGGGGSGGTTNYNQLTNRPQINGNTLEGNLTAEDLGLQPENLVVTLTQNGESITADKSYADINQAYTDGKDIYAVIEGNIVPLYGNAGTTYIFQSVLGVQVTDFELNSENTWSVETINIIANSTRPGGIIADEKTDDDTVEVHVDSKTGKAYVNASQDTTSTTPPIINTASGNPITLTDSSDNLLQSYEMDGKTEQVTTTGAQLFDERAKVPETKLTPFPVFVGEGTFTLSTNAGQAGTGNSFIFFASGNVSSGGDGVYKGKSVSVQSNDGYVTVFGRIMNNINPFDTYNTMLNAGSTALPYEPYTGGAPSPSPDYPQPIINGGTYDEETEKWEYEVSVGGAQLFDASKIPTKTQGGATVTNNGDGSFTISGSGNLSGIYSHQVALGNQDLETFKKSLKQGNITLKCESVTVPYFQININTSDGEEIIFPNDFVAQITKNLDQDQIDKIIEVRLIFYGNNGTQITDTTIRPMLYQDGNGTWEPYRTPQTVTLTADRPLTKWDKLEKRNGQWGWVYKSNTHTFNGNTDEGWYKEQDYVVSGLLRDEIAKDKEVYCGEFMDARKNSATSPYISVSKSGLVVVKYTQYTNGDISAWNEYVTSNPFVIWYETAEETFTPLTTEESAALDALVSYYPTTVISNQQGLNMTVDYIADTKTYIDNKFAELQQSLANTNAQLLGGN